MIRKIRVLIVDDSAIVRRVIADSIAKESDMEVVGAAPDPYVARDLVLSQKPDVLTLDIEMPRMDGLTFLTKLMQFRPTPTIIISSVAQSTCDVAVEAMRRGAVEVVAKPSGPFSASQIALTLATKIRAAYGAKVRKMLPNEAAATPPSPAVPLLGGSTAGIIAIGASTGGTQAIEQVLAQLPQDCPPIVIAQHIPAGFSASFAARLNTVCKMEVKEAVNGDIVAPGRALVAPGNFHMIYRKADGISRVSVKDGPLIHYQRPAVDILFRSVAEARIPCTVGVLLTGMGSDGAEGLLKLRQSGAHTIAQDEASCVVFGMPKVAIELGAAAQVMPLLQIPLGILSAHKRNSNHSLTG